MEKDFMPKGGSQESEEFWEDSVFQANLGLEIKPIVFTSTISNFKF